MTRFSGPYAALFCALSLTACGAPEATGTRSTNDGGSASDAGSTNDAGSSQNDGHQFTIVTSLGTLKVELDAINAPLTVANFEQYADEGFYDGLDGAGATTFHRVISGFMIQGGGFSESGVQKPTRSSIAIESDNGLANSRGTLAMARTDDPNSATSQFFINHVDNNSLNYVNPSNPGYAVFGEVIEGLDVLDAIAAVDIDRNNKPLTPVVILSVTRATAP